ncbi:MAG: phosphoribosylamine--glycine ligase [Acidobacteriota bacterium]|jgi:phosphoribosylamine--glycine ligase|nr:phosphoribosylamine--glycine ligase [Acidobacteriota bacterium]
MKILVIGSGGREHAIIWAFKQSETETKIFCADGNAGIAEIADCIDISPTDIDALANFAEQEQIDLTFVGGETSLALGIVNEFEKRGLKVIGATQAAAQLESSKVFAKDFMNRHKIPTAKYASANSAEEAFEILKRGDFGDENSPVVIKADGLAAGKGVVVAKNKNEAIKAIYSMVSGELIAADAARKIVLEECLIGKEVSLLMFTDGKNFALMPPTRDHKRIGEGDTGANTGGMGTITDTSLLTAAEIQLIKDEIIKPTLEGAAAEGFPFKGILFLGLMLTDSGIKVLEYNVRFGDPETQAILVNLETDLIEICESISNQTLNKLIINWKEGSSACVILAAENYPKSPEKGDVINGLKEVGKQENVFVFHAGTSKNVDGNFITNGGRVLGVTATASNLSNALHRAYKAVNEIDWKGMQYRRDIGK